MGKTRILLEWNRLHDGLYTIADQSTPEVQRRYFAEAVSTRFGGIQEARYPDWAALLRRVAQEAAATGWRGPLILDEFPYLAGPSPELPSVLQRWLDHEARAAGLVVALAGSSQRMMQGLTLSPSAPLYGRAIEAMPIDPLMPGYLGEGLGLTDPVECVQAYSAWGGVPRYWELAETAGAELDAAVDRCVLDPLGPLHTEPDRLLQEELPPALVLRPILDVIGMGAHRLSEIAGRLGQPATSLARPIGRLIELGLVCRDRPHGDPEKGAKRALYRIADPFCRMWFQTVAPHRALLAQAPRMVRLAVWKRERGRLFAEAWEELCRSAVARLEMTDSPLAGLGPWQPSQRYWHGGGPEWDVVSLSVDRKRLLLGEVKWSPTPLSASDLRRVAARLLAKGVPPIAGAMCEIVRALFVPRAARGPKTAEGMTVVDAQSVLQALRED